MSLSFFRDSILVNSLSLFLSKSSIFLLIFFKESLIRLISFLREDILLCDSNILDSFSLFLDVLVCSFNKLISPFNLSVSLVKSSILLL